jgi:hypothetical protein
MTGSSAPKVFISHASSDQDWPGLAVEAVANRLKSRGAEVWLDLWHERDIVRHKLPLAEWRDWMRHCLDTADHVLCLCSPRYANLAKRAENSIPEGRGIAFEAFEIEKRLYDQKQRNRDWVWLLRLDEASTTEVVPVFLRDRCPEYGTPTEEQRLVDELVPMRGPVIPPKSWTNNGDVPASGAPEPGQSGLPEPDTLGAQRRLVDDRLKEAASLWIALGRDDWEDARPPAPAFLSSTAFAQWLSAASAADAINSMFAARRALAMLDRDEKVRLDAKQRHLAELATVSIYCLALCRCVNVDALRAGLRFPREIKDTAHLYCAVIATVLAGGKLELVHGDESDRPRAEHAYEIHVPAAGDHREQVFERAVYQALFADSKSATVESLDDVELSPALRKAIAGRLQTIRRVHRQAFTLIVQVDALYPPADSFAQQYRVPVFICGDDIAEPLIGMSAGDLVVAVEELWRELRYCSLPADGAGSGRPGARNTAKLDGAAGQVNGGTVHNHDLGGKAPVTQGAAGRT